MQKALTVFGLTLLLAGGSVLAFLELAGAGEEQMVYVLRGTAWTAILVYVVVFIARPLQQLLGTSQTRKLLKNRRYFGVALAAIMTVHLVLLLIVNEKAFNVPGAAIYLLMYLMLLTSFDSAPAKLGPRNWRLLHKTGLYGLGIGFSNSVVGQLFREPLNPIYLLLTFLLLAAVAIRVAAFRKRRG